MKFFISFCFNIILFYCASVIASGADGMYVGIGLSNVNYPASNFMGLTREKSSAQNLGLHFGYKLTETIGVEASYSHSIKNSFEQTPIYFADDYLYYLKELFDASLAVGRDYDKEPTYTYPRYLHSGRGKITSSVETQALSLSGAYRTSGDLYIKLTAGVTFSLVQADVGFIGNVNETDYEAYPIDATEKFSHGLDILYSKHLETDDPFSVGVSGSAGVGYKISSQYMVELDYTVSERSMNNYSFTLIYSL